MKFLGKSIPLVLSGMLLVTGAVAAVPKLSGNYIFTMTGSCPVDADKNSRGEISGSLYQVKVTPNNTGVAGSVVVSGYDVVGSSLAGGDPSDFEELNEESIDKRKITYTNSQNSVTFKAGGETRKFHVFYGSVDKSNIAHYAAIMSLEDSDHSGVKCLTQGTLVRQR